jgi:hypothetical protein
LALLLPVVITGLSRAQDCERAELGAHLVEDPVVACRLEAGVTSAARWATYAYICLPAAIFAWCAYEGPLFSKLDFLSKGYHQLSVAAMYYECITLSRKALVMGLATRAIFFDSASRDPRVNMVFTVELLAFSLLVHQWVLPFGRGVHHNVALNWLEIQALVASIIVALSILSRMQSQMGLDLPMPVDDQNRMDIFGLTACLPFFLRWIVLFVDATPLGAGRLSPALWGATLSALNIATAPVLAVVKGGSASLRRAGSMALQGLAAAGRFTRVLAARSSRALTGALLREPPARPPPEADSDEEGEGEEGRGGKKETADQAATRLYREAIAALKRRAAARVGLTGDEHPETPLRPAAAGLAWERPEGGAAALPPPPPALPPAGGGGGGGGGGGAGPPLAHPTTLRAPFPPQPPRRPQGGGGGDDVFEQKNPLWRRPAAETESPASPAPPPRRRLSSGSFSPAPLPGAPLPPPLPPPPQQQPPHDFTLRSPPNSQSGLGVGSPASGAGGGGARGGRPQPLLSSAPPRPDFDAGAAYDAPPAARRPGPLSSQRPPEAHAGAAADEPRWRDNPLNSRA